MKVPAFACSVNVQYFGLLCFILNVFLLKGTLQTFLVIHQITQVLRIPTESHVTSFLLNYCSTNPSISLLTAPLPYLWSSLLCTAIDDNSNVQGRKAIMASRSVVSEGNYRTSQSACCQEGRPHVSPAHPLSRTSH